ncbi:MULTISPECIES: hypothetical protein [unclassified Modestobacter]|uniref:hypothetical protein n=1 Tax=unclassified Modestobacter TaxID=2643866 RepID=UPI0022AA091D|nr:MULTISPECIES: hypothetical protein [unclassified Modestobacter]MCZ2825856.1 hypothetical protein [Modestobacter sp. VKM Ac-2981]MCZ2853079.1 hypothetical protein [Modestobacter sp. VKM Ac-2982]
MTITASLLTRATGGSAVLSGLRYVVIQPINPQENVATVTGTAWWSRRSKSNEVHVRYRLGFGTGIPS